MKQTEIDEIYNKVRAVITVDGHPAHLLFSIEEAKTLFAALEELKHIREQNACYDRLLEKSVLVRAENYAALIKEKEQLKYYVDLWEKRAVAEKEKNKKLEERLETLCDAIRYATQPMGIKPCVSHDVKGHLTEVLENEEKLKE